MNVNEALQKASHVTTIGKFNTDTWSVRYYQPGLNGFFKEYHTADFKTAKVRAKYCKLDAFMLLMGYDVTSCADNPLILNTQDDWQVVARNLHNQCFDRFVADRAKTAKSELSDVVLTKDMTQEERRSAFLAAIGR